MAPSESEPVPDPERARRTAGRLLWAAAVLTLIVGLFQLAGIIPGARVYDALAWIGVSVTGLAMLGLIAIYVACALDRASLRQTVLGRFDLFQVSTVLMVLAIVAGVLVPTRNSTALALLLPWGLTYWLRNLPTSDAP